MKSIATLSELKDSVGRLGTSEWLTVTQERIDMFAEATGDHYWIHVDQERARRGPHGGTIAHGYLTLSLIPFFLWGVLEFPRTSGLNYGLDRVRFPAPVPCGSQVRAHLDLVSVGDVDGGAQVKIKVTIEVAGGEKPACVAEAIFRWYVR
jgi:acyl dehydratase